MEKIVVKFVTGLSPNATMWERKIHKRYGKVGNVCKQINYDIKQGATIEQVILLLHKIRNDPSFSDLRATEGSLERLDALENEILSDERKFYWN